MSVLFSKITRTGLIWEGEGNTKHQKLSPLKLFDKIVLCASDNLKLLKFLKMHDNARQHAANNKPLPNKMWWIEDQVCTDGNCPALRLH